MANSLYAKARERFLLGQLNWDTDDIRIVPCDTNYVAQLEVDEYLSDIPVNRRFLPGKTLVNRSATDGYAFADGVQFDVTPDGRQIKSLVIYVEGATEADSPLIAYIDQGGGLPFTPTGLTYTVSWDAAFGGIFRL